MLRFDDSWQDQWINALPVLQRYNFPAAFLAITGGLQNVASIPTSSPDTIQYMNWNEFEWLYSHGYEIVDHSSTHPDMNYLTWAGLNYEVDRSAQALASHGITNVPAFALPYGDAWTNETVISYILSAGFIHVYSAYGSPALTGYSKVATVWYPIDLADNDPSFSLFQELANQASSSVAVGFEFHHVFANSADANSGDPYSISLDQFNQDMAYLASGGFTVILPMNLPGYFNISPLPPITTTSSSSSSTTTFATSESSSSSSSSGQPPGSGSSGSSTISTASNSSSTSSSFSFITISTASGLKSAGGGPSPQGSGSRSNSGNPNSFGGNGGASSSSSSSSSISIYDIYPAVAGLAMGTFFVSSRAIRSRRQHHHRKEAEN